jgi:hypothetical protein
MFSYLYQDMRKTFSELMKAYHFLSTHLKFEVEFPRDGPNPPPKHPKSIRENNLPVAGVNVDDGDSNSFGRHPRRSEPPAVWEHSK